MITLYFALEDGTVFGFQMRGLPKKPNELTPVSHAPVPEHVREWWDKNKHMHDSIGHIQLEEF